MISSCTAARECLLRQRIDPRVGQSSGPSPGSLNCGLELSGGVVHERQPGAESMSTILSSGATIARRSPGCPKTVRVILAAVLSVAATALLANPEANYDLVIRGGRIVDGTGNPWFYGDLAVNADRIAAVGRVAGDAKRLIDANGLVVAPGFIDMHSHSDWVLLEAGNAQSKIRQGGTTTIIGESTS